MASPSDLLPVIVGVGRLTQRLNKDAPVTPLHQFISEAVKRAAADAVASSASSAKVEDILLRVDCICTPGSLTSMHASRMWEREQGRKRVNFHAAKYPEPYANLPGAVARASGCRVPAERLFTSGVSGTMPQWFVSMVAEKIANGEIHCGVVAGGECMATLQKKIGMQRWRELYADWDTDAEFVDLPEGHMANDFTAQEAKHNLAEPGSVFPIYEQAMRASIGRGLTEHSEAIAGLCAGMSEVAATSPEHAWFPRRKSAKEIMEPTAENAYNYYPYTKSMNAFAQVDQTAAVILMSAGLARELLGPKAPLVYLHGCGDAREPGTILERPILHRSPPMDLAVQSAYRQAGITAKQISYWELYACFPASIGFAARSASAPEPERGSELTQLGGLMYHGGPGANYVTHALCALVGRLRADPGEYGFLYAPGGMNTKHTAAIYSSRPPAGAWKREPLAENRAKMEAMPRRVVSQQPSGRGEVESYTVQHVKGQARRVIVVGTLLQGGQRFVAVSEDPELCKTTTSTRDLVGTLVDVATDAGGTGTFVPAPAAKL